MTWGCGSLPSKLVITIIIAGATFVKPQSEALSIFFVKEFDLGSGRQEEVQVRQAGTFMFS